MKAPQVGESILWTQLTRDLSFNRGAAVGWLLTSEGMDSLEQAKFFIEDEIARLSKAASTEESSEHRSSDIDPLRDMELNGKFVAYRDGNGVFHSYDGEEHSQDVKNCVDFVRNATCTRNVFTSPMETLVKDFIFASRLVFYSGNIHTVFDFRGCQYIISYYDYSKGLVYALNINKGFEVTITPKHLSNYVPTTTALRIP